MPPSEHKTFTDALIADEHLPTWIARINLRDKDKHWLHQSLREVRPQDNHRGLWLMNVSDFVLSQRGVQAYTSYLSLLTALGVNSYFSFIPFRASALLFSQAASLCLPNLPLGEALDLFIFQLLNASRHNPLIQINMRALPDFIQFMKLQIRSMRTWQRFGRADIEVHSRDHVSVHFDEDYTALMMPIHVGTARGFLQMFKHSSDCVQGKAHDAHSFTLEIKW